MVLVYNGLSFRQHKHEKSLLPYSTTKKSFLGYKNKKFKKKLTFFLQGLTLGFGLKMAIFPTFIFGNIGQKHVLQDILERKYDFLGYKIKKFKKSKNCDFSKGVNQWFWYNNGHFSNFFFLGTIGQKNVFYDILERIKAFLGYENKKLKKSKN